MVQNYARYTNDDFLVWKTLFERQYENLQNKADHTYLNSLEEFKTVLHADAIPNFDKLNEKLHHLSGWTLEVVPGLIPVDQFFRFLSQKKFCSSTWLRKMSQLDYLEEPDMFHDIFGHIPLLSNPDYAGFMHKFGELGVQYCENKTIEVQLQRLYWFTIEFGLIRHQNASQIYGAGIISSFGETNHIYKDAIEVLPYSVEKILENDFINSEIQMRYYEIDSFEALYNSVNHLKAQLQANAVVD